MLVAASSEACDRALYPLAATLAPRALAFAEEAAGGSSVPGQIRTTPDLLDALQLLSKSLASSGLCHDAFTFALRYVGACEELHGPE